MPVFLLLGVIWAAVLVPPWLQSRGKPAHRLDGVPSVASSGPCSATSPGYGPTSRRRLSGYDAATTSRDRAVTGTHRASPSTRSTAVAGGAVHALGQSRDPATNGPGRRSPLIRSPADDAPRGMSGAASTARRRRLPGPPSGAGVLSCSPPAWRRPCCSAGHGWLAAGSRRRAARDLPGAPGTSSAARGRAAPEGALPAPIGAPRPSVVVLGTGDRRCRRQAMSASVRSAG